MESKSQIRQRMRQLRREITPEIFRESCSRIHDRLLAEPDFKRSRKVLFYLSMPEEIETDGLIEEAFQQNKRVCLPVVHKGQDDMTLVWITGPLADWQRGPFGIRQPAIETGTIASPEELDLVVTPGLAFTPSGVRLGYGKGYFDRLFVRLKPECHRIALAFDFQILDAIPQTDQDQPVHRIVSETRTTVCREF